MTKLIQAVVLATESCETLSAINTLVAQRDSVKFLAEPKSDRRYAERK